MKRTFLTTFADEPAEFINKWLESQSRDLESALGSGPSEGLTVREALEGYTSHAAQAIRATDEGHLQPGARAALTVFAADPFDLRPFDLATIPVVATYVDGVPVETSRN